ncbi:hypothetical protein K438DRAFT_1757768 [Mycena galopus ATCC 62051]|nr:hypothetical protein K438DRAFT_1757768 [Mycena galopus ATCC 62051]
MFTNVEEKVGPNLVAGARNPSQRVGCGGKRERREVHDGMAARALVRHRSPQANDMKQICRSKAAPLSADLDAQSKSKLPVAVRESGYLQISRDIGTATQNDEGMCERLEYMEGKSRRYFGRRLDVLMQLQTISGL